MLKKILCIMIAVLLMICLFACGEDEQQKGELTLSANSKTGHEALYAMDGDNQTGWISSKKASDINFQVLEIDFGERKTFNKIVIDDSFSQGYTNSPPEYLKKSVTYSRGNISSFETGSSPANVLSGAADGSSWISHNIPSENSPEWIWLSLEETVSATKIVLDNSMNNSSFESFKFYYSIAGTDSREVEIISNPESFDGLLYQSVDNSSSTLEILLSEEITIKELLLVISSQINEGENVKAALDEIFFYGNTPVDYSEPHQPVRFTIMASDDGITYQTIKAVTGNYQTIWVGNLEKSVTYRYIKYLIFEENNNNYPSIGEIQFLSN